MMKHDREAITGSALLEAIVGAVRSHPAVHRLHGTRFDAVASYLEDPRLDGVRVEQATVDLSVVLRRGKPLPTVVDELRRRVAALVGGATIDVVVTDVVIGEEAAVTGAPRREPPAGRRMSPQQRAEFRQFVRSHHPDVGGDPDEFAAGLACLRAQATDSDRNEHRFDRPVVFISRRQRRQQAVLRAVRKLDRIRRGNPPRTVQ